MLTWTGWFIAVLGPRELPKTGTPSIHSFLSNSPGWGLHAPITSFRAGVPCSPRTPFAVNWNKVQLSHLSRATEAMVAPYFFACLPGQGSSLQYCFLIASPRQGLPPFSASWSIVLFEVCMPPSHVLEQASHAPQLPHSQSTGKKFNYLIWDRQQRQWLPLTF